LGLLGCEMGFKREAYIEGVVVERENNNLGCWKLLTKYWNILIIFYIC
jgi:hypothetical protein